MKAFLHRLHIGGGPKDKDKESPVVQKEKFPPLRPWPPEEPQRPVPTPTPTNLPSFKPLPELAAPFTAPLSTRPLPPIEEPVLSSSTPSTPAPPPAPQPLPPVKPPPEPAPLSPSPRPVEQESLSPPSRKPANGSLSQPTVSDVQKKVAFISPPPTPTPMNMERALPDAPGTTPQSVSAPLKTNVTRFQATHGRASVSTAPSSSKTDLNAKASVKATSIRGASPYLSKQDVSASSVRSGTPYSQMSAGSSSRILAATSWSEVTEEDLVSNLGSRERTRQEVLFEIISSEDRYVQELVKMKETFIDPLLHPFAASAVSPASSTPNLDYDYYRSESPTTESGDHLPPIAARFMSPTPSIGVPASATSSARNKDTPNIDGDSLETDEEHDDTYPASSRRIGASSPTSKADHPRSPYRSAASRTGGRLAAVPFPSKSHHSLPPPPRTQMSASTTSLGRQATAIDRERERDRERKYSQGQDSSPSQKRGMLRKLKKSQTSSDAVFGSYLAPRQIPDDLRICLEVIDNGVLEGHKRLSGALKKRYDDQFPLVRSLADVFVANSDIFQGYATYVLHLERALEQVDAALQNISTKKPKKQDAEEWQKVCKFLQKLEEDAADKGETGLAITLSKPFQRLLKYPLLFQNLLFHTDPSTFEYESTLQMVAEVETIVRSIEDEKIQKEERDKTRDVFARIEGLEKVKQLALPKPSRVLLEERPCPSLNAAAAAAAAKPSSPPPVVNNKGVRGKSSFKRLSDVLHSGGMGGKKDLWFVVFNDVVLQCQRTGTTSLPMVAGTNSRTNSLPELQGKAKYATTGRRNAYTKPRNLYKFIKIETWAIGDVMQPREGVVSMEDVVRSSVQARHQPRIVPLPNEDDEDGDSDDSDKKSKMSFSYWGADKITVQKPVLKGRAGSQLRRATPTASYGRESSANAKFGTRLVSIESPHAAARPASRRAQTATPTIRKAPTSEDGPNYAKATITRPAWDATTRTPPPKRTRNTSQTSAGTRSTIPAKSVSSPAPSEDSGVGLYRQMLANDPSLTES